ncbi:MAG TPA: hypothetical protein VFC53_06920 [Dehalococcoidia bacterium]|nr:hypothetical protein [Dehalococcoidia bacterium]
MPDDPYPPDAGQDASPAPADPHQGMTSGGYRYEVIDEGAPPRAAAVPRAPRDRRPVLLALAVLAPAALVGVGVWFLAQALDGGGGRARNGQADVASVLNAVAMQQGATTDRFEGELPPGLPDVPKYPGASVVSAVRQVSGDDVLYLVVWDSNDNRAKVAKYFEDQFGNDPWQLEASETNADATSHQFSRIDDGDVSGVVLIGQSNEDAVSTIVLSLRVVSGAKDIQPGEFDTTDTASLPPGFPSDLPQYPGSTIVQSGYSKAPRTTSFAVSFATRDGAADVLDYYRSQLVGSGYTVADADASDSALEGAEAISFDHADGTRTGRITAGELPEDKRYTRIDIELQAQTSSSGGS